MSTDKNLVESLNHLISISNDGKSGYHQAASYLQAGEVKDALLRFSQERSQFIQGLKFEVRKAGGDPERAGGTLGSLHRVWMDVKSSFNENDPESILSACRTGDRAALKAYQEVLEKVLLPADTRNMVAAQKMRISDTITQLKALSLRVKEKHQL